VLGLRVSRRWGPARIGYRLGMAPATVHRILTRYRCVRLRYTDPATGAPLRATRRQVHRYEHPAPGELVHVDITKLGRIPDGGGHEILGRQAGRKNRRDGTGYWYIHNAVDDHSRLAYSELLTDERKDTAAGFWSRARAYFDAAGITVARVLTDNGACYRSHAFRDALGQGITHKRTRPYRPQTNGKVERFNRTLLEEWAYARPYALETERARCMPWRSSSCIQYWARSWSTLRSRRFLSLSTSGTLPFPGRLRNVETRS
jgi:transposase InsO family protein